MNSTDMDWGQQNVIEQPDMVNKPPHYQLLPGVEVYDVRHALLEKTKPCNIWPN